MSGGYVIGVDGGNTKTDFVLADAGGRVLAAIRTGTCSHERMTDSFAGARRELGRHLEDLHRRAGVKREETGAAVFGLAGVDTPAQQQRLSAIVKELGYPSSRVINDSYLAIPAVSRDGTGICSINGTGTVVGGIDAKGGMVQVGGIGIVATGDYGGGSYYAQCTVGAAYDQLFRNGPATSLTAGVLELLEAGEGRELLIHIQEKVLGKREMRLPLMRLLFSACEQGDEVARRLVENSARQLAASVVGCASRLEFPGEINVVCAGSIWLRAETPLLFGRFCASVEAALGSRAVIARLKAPPVCGAVQWARKDLLGEKCRFAPELEEQVRQAVCPPHTNLSL